MASKPPTPQGISRLLGHAGFERARKVGPHRTHWDGRPVSGSRKQMPGFKVQAAGSAVTVRFMNGLVTSPDDTAELRMRMLRRYGTEIRHHGYSPLIMTPERQVPYLIVTAKEDGTDG